MESELSELAEISDSFHFHGADVLTLRDFDRERIETVFRATKIVERNQEPLSEFLKRKKIVVMFYEPSTRTEQSSEIGAEDLGARIYGFRDSGVTSSTKGETIHDEVRMYEQWGANPPRGVDCFIIRSPWGGAAQYASELTEVPVINAGDGVSEHPTQGLLDLMTIKNEVGKIDDLTYLLMGDLRHGRTPYPLCYGLSNYEIDKIYFAAPSHLQIRDEATIVLEDRGVKFEKVKDAREVVSEADIIYDTRIQKERYADPRDYERDRGSFVVDLQLLKNAKSSARVMHPLPRVDELAYEVDNTPFALYGRQAYWGRLVRMTLLTLILGDFNGRK